jgi:hypothetical protein
MCLESGRLFFFLVAPQPGIPIFVVLTHGITSTIVKLGQNFYLQNPWLKSSSIDSQVHSLPQISIILVIQLLNPELGPPVAHGAPARLCLGPCDKKGRHLDLLWQVMRSIDDSDDEGFHQFFFLSPNLNQPGGFENLFLIISLQAPDFVRIHSHS